MTLINKINRSKAIFICILAFIFLLMLLLNFLTPYVCDDYSYMYSFEDDSVKITSISQIFPSMAAHARVQNGRVVAHFLVQLFLLLPKAVFNVVNAAVFTFSIYLLYRSVFDKKEYHNLFLLAVFSACVYFEAVFGQVNLWLDGSINYLWCIIPALLFLKPYTSRFLSGTKVFSGKTLSFVLFCVLSLLFGAYSESGSSAAVFMAVVLGILSVFLKKDKIDLQLVLPIVLACIGYLFMATRPATLAVKMAAKWSLTSIGSNFESASTSFKAFLPLLLVYLGLIVFGSRSFIPKSTLILSLILFAGSLFSNFIVIFGYCNPRSLYYPCIFLIMAVAVLLPCFKQGNWKRLYVFLLATVVLVSAFDIIAGTKDVATVNRKNSENISSIEAQKASGCTDISLPILTANTKFSAIFENRYLVSDPNTFPNDAMANYFDVHSISGYWPIQP